MLRGNKRSKGKKVLNGGWGIVDDDCGGLRV